MQQTENFRFFRVPPADYLSPFAEVYREARAKVECERAVAAAEGGNAEARSIILRVLNEKRLYYAAMCEAVALNAYGIGKNAA